MVYSGRQEIVLVRVRLRTRVTGGRYHPLAAAQGRERGVKAALVRKGREVAEEGEAAGCVQGFEAVGEEPAE